ncbi:MAG: SusC/RagA family TonB-linked outer membrane protein [Bacteroidota bacterium]
MGHYLRKLLFFIVLTAFTVPVWSQGNRVIRGTVKAADDGFPLPGVNVLVKGTSRGTATDGSGGYTLELAAGENELVFSFVGYKTQTEAVGSRTLIDVSLEPDAETLEEVVVVGYGVVNKSDLTGSVSSVKGNDLLKIPNPSPVQALQGKLAGVQVTSSSGAPGASPVVRIRGIGTFNNANPIYVVDGVILDNIDFLNSSDIQSMEVLKDASSTAIYGSRGANGVIIVTTKKGKQGQEVPVINVTADYSVQHLANRIDLLNGKEFAQVVNEITPGSYNNVDAVPNTDWQDLIFRNAPIQNYQVSVTGASARSQYYYGVGYFNQQGIIPKSDFQRISVKLNNTYHLSKAVRLGSNVTLAPSQQQNTFGGAVFNVYRSQPTIAPRQTDGTYSPVPGVGNVLADIDYTNSFSEGLRSVANFYGEVDFLKGFTFKSSFGADVNYNKSRSFTPVFFVSTLQQNPINDLNKGWSNALSWLWENTVSYQKEVGAHRLNAIAGYTAQDISSEFFSVAGQNIIRESQDFWYLNPSNINPNTANNGVDLSQNYSMVSYLFRANYTFDNKYLLTFTYRRDGSSKFTKKNRYADFPAIALGWNIINESFLDNVDMLSNLKVRASWGIIGNEKIEYTRQYSRVLNGINGVFGSAEAIYPGATYGVSGNPNLIWENSYQTDIGVELGFLDDRITAEVDYYHKTTKDILIDLTVPGYLGNGDGATITFNAGEVLNKGLEFNLGYSGEWNQLKYRVGANGTTIHNETLRISGDAGPGDFRQNGNGTTRTYVGDPIGSFFGYRVIGVFQNQQDLDSYPHRSDAGIGDLKYEDVNKDGVLNADDRTNIGSPIPKFFYGFNSEFFYKAFDLSIDFQGQMGNKIYNHKETVRPDLYNFEQRVLGRWRGEGTSTTEPKASPGGYNFLPSTRFIQDGGFFRLRSISLGYTLPTAMAARVGMKTARVYARGTNVFTLSKFTGYTPEIGSGNVLDSSIDYGTYPIPSVYSLGLNVTF